MKTYMYKLPNGQTRVDMKALLADPRAKRELGIRFIMSMQEHEGRDANRQAAEQAYDNVQREQSHKVK